MAEYDYPPPPNRHVPGLTSEMELESTSRSLNDLRVAIAGMQNWSYLTSSNKQLLSFGFQDSRGDIWFLLNCNTDGVMRVLLYGAAWTTLSFDVDVDTGVGHIAAVLLLPVSKPNTAWFSCCVCLVTSGRRGGTSLAVVHCTTQFPSMARRLVSKRLCTEQK